MEKDQPRPSPYEHENAAHYDELVAACAAVASPEEAVVAPVWRAAVGDAPVTLSALLSPEVRQYRRVVARVEAAQRQHDEYRRRYLVNDLAREWQTLTEAIGDDQAAAVIRYLFDGPLRAINAREDWGLAHLDLMEQTAEWWATARTDAEALPPASLVAAWRAICPECWLAQADWLLGDNAAARVGDPRLCRPAAAVAAGDLADERDLRPVSPIDGHAALDEAMTEHERLRSAAVASSLHALPLHRRVRADRADLEAAYDAAHLFVCPSCALPRNDDDPPGRGYRTPTCRCCDGPLVRLADAPTLPPPLDESLARVAARRSQLRGRR